PGPTLTDPHLTARTVVQGLNQPTSLAFIGSNSFFVLEKATGKVQHVVNGSVAGAAIDLAVNNASERGLLGIALHPQFASNHWVYLYWTCSSPVPADPSMPSMTECADPPATGADTNN